MQSRAVEAGLEQRLGRRLGLEPYYRIVEQRPGRLRLESRPEANAGAGRRIMAGGAALIAVAALIALSGLYAAGSGVGFAAAALGAVVGGFLGAIGYQRAFGGYAVLTTRNSIEADSAAGAMIFTQGNKVAPERTQRLPLAAVTGLRLRRRPFATGALVKRAQPVVALELLAGREVWIVDSAEEPERLRELAEGLSEVLGVELSGQ
jgi:hypothetical protein